MSVIIDEVVANIETPQETAPAAAAAPGFSDDQQQQLTFDLLHIQQERKARLVID